MDQEERFRVGDPVRLAADVRAQGVPYTRRLGQIVGHGRKPFLFTVRWEGLKHVQTWHQDSLELVE